MLTSRRQIDIGSLRTSINLLHQVAGTDESGTVVMWQPFKTLRAAIDPVSATSQIRSGQDVSQVYVNVVIRFTAGVKSGMRVQAPNGTYDVVAIQNVEERNTKLILTCLALRDAS